MEDVYETEIDGFYARQKWNGSAFHVYDVGGVYPGFYRYVCKKQYTQHDCICDLCICIFPCVLQKYWQASG